MRNIIKDLLGLAVILGAVLFAAWAIGIVLSLPVG